MPNLYWFGMIDGHYVMITDVMGTSLDEIFDRASRFFNIELVLELAVQLISRLEWMHSRQITHGNLTPASFAIADSPWQHPQVILAGLAGADSTNSSTKNDLKAVGEILLYLLSGSQSWCDFQIQGHLQNGIPPILSEYFSQILGQEINPADYMILRRQFHDARQRLQRRTLIGGLNPSVENGLNLKSLACKSTGDLFEILGSLLCNAGQGTKTSWTKQQGKLLLTSLSEVMVIYIALLIRDRPSKTRSKFLMGAYHLPNRLWRDIRWYLCVSQYGPHWFQQEVTLTVYKYMGVLFEVIPMYQKYWTGFLSEIAHTQIALHEDHPYSWRDMWIYWKDRSNMSRGGQGLI